MPPLPVPSASEDRRGGGGGEEGRRGAANNRRIKEAPHAEPARTSPHSASRPSDRLTARRLLADRILIKNRSDPGMNNELRSATR